MSIVIFNYGGDLMKDETRYVFSTGDLTQKDFSIQLKNEKGNTYLPIKDVKELYCFNDMTITTKLFSALSKANITLHIFDYNGNYAGTYFPKRYLLSGKLVVKQALKYDSDRISPARNIVRGIGKNLYTVMYHYYRHGKNELKEYLDWLRNDEDRLIDVCCDINQLMMIEGEMWARFYSSFKYILPEDFIMNKRVRRPPDNPINALISFGNTILYTKTISQLYHTHLNQEISFLHSPSEGRFSLSLDISEVFKPIIVFRTIFDCVNNRKITVSKHFESKYNYCMLNEEGRKVFISEFEKRLNSVFDHPRLKRKISYKQAIKIDGYKLIKWIMEDKEFVPFALEDKM